MAKPDWGTKRTCQSCGIPFYDLKKKNIECPKCGAAFIPVPAAKPKRPAPAESKPVEKKPEVPAKKEAVAALVGDADTDILDDEDDELVALVPEDDSDDALIAGVDDEDDEEDDALIEDTSDLGTEDDDMSEVKEHIDDGVEDKN
ncbi:MAG: TIGR02300 family protein [Alphaproteobacteria bacterium]|nr:TIGR02300 family protein [Alphaproteobacteria bacterium]